MSARAANRGFTLIELMVALVLGLILTGAAISAFVANRRVYAATESLGRVQENARAAFELMSRDAREAAGNACNSKIQPVNVLRGNLAAYPYADFMGGLAGTDLVVGGKQRDAVVFKSATDTGAAIDSDNSTNVNILTVTSLPDIAENDIVLICDPERAAIFQVTKAHDNSFGIQDSNDPKTVPGNSTNCLLGDVNGDGKENDCGNGSIKRYAFGCQNGEWEGGKGCSNGAAPAFLSKLRSISWYIAAGSKGGTSLYRKIEGPGVVDGDEIAEGVTGMELTYLVDSNTYLTATDVTAGDLWTQVRAIRINLEFEGEDKSATANPSEALARRVSHVVALRNRING